MLYDMLRDGEGTCPGMCRESAPFLLTCVASNIKDFLPSLRLDLWLFAFERLGSIQVPESINQSPTTTMPQLQNPQHLFAGKTCAMRLADVNRRVFQ